MVFIGLSIFVASLTIFCYKHPPSSWSILSWFRENGLKSHRTDITAPAALKSQGLREEDTQNDVARASNIDREAMPPPPLRLRKAPTSTTASISEPTSYSTTPGGSSIASTIFTPINDLSLLPPPVFPARGSIQRVSGGQGPPRLRPTPILQPPLRSPLPNRSPAATSSSSLAPPPTHNAIPTKPRTKVQLSPGHSPLDWAHLSSSPNANLRGLPPTTSYLRVPPSLLHQYTGRKGKDAWTVLGGKVYNITPYLPYHPGGEPELLRAAGRDGSKLFGEVHPWVNWEGMLEPCLVGVAVGQDEIKQRSQLEDMD